MTRKKDTTQIITRYLAAGAALLLLVGCDSSTSSNDEEFYESKQSEILGGQVATDDQYPSVVRIPGCSATLIAPTWVLTAAHCVCDTVPEAGGRYSSDASRCNHVVSTVFLRAGAFESIPGHSMAPPEFVQRGTIDVNGRLRPEVNVADIALIRLDRSAPAAFVPIPARLPDPGRIVHTDPTGGTKGPMPILYMVGYGSGVCDPTSGGTRRFASTNTYSLPGGSYVIQYTGAVSGGGSMPGDSGGPLINNDLNGVPQENVVGVASTGSAVDNCGRSIWPILSTYTNVALYSRWIHTVTGIPYNSYTII